jgi:tRNA modification GTPase
MIDPVRLWFGRFVEGDETIDEVIVSVRMQEGLGDVIDVTAHGGVRVVERILLSYERLGAVVEREAVAPLRAGSLIEREAIELLCRAKTRQAVRFLAHQRVALPQALEEVSGLCDGDESAGRARLEALLADSGRTRFLIDGATLAFMGPPNAGKSTLINCLFAGSQSLVSPQAGTTRDWVGVSTALDEVPVTVIDTAGIREEADGLEREAISRSIDRIKDADVQIVVMDGSTPFASAFLERIRSMIDPAYVVAVQNKSDLPWAWAASEFGGLGTPAVITSGRTGAGLPELRKRLGELLAVPQVDLTRAALFTDRQRHELARILSDVEVSALGQAIRSELICPNHL